MPLGIEVGLGLGDFVYRWGLSSTPQKGGGAPQFSAHVYCGQTARWMKTPRGTEVGLGPGHIVLDGDPALLPPKGTQHGPKFSAHISCGQMAGWITMPLGMEVGLGPGDFVLDGDPAPPSREREQSPPKNFRPMFIVAKRLDG